MNIPRVVISGDVFSVDWMGKLISQRPDLVGPADQAGKLGDFGIIPKEGRNPTGMVNKLGSVSFGCPGAVAQHVGILSNDHGQLKAGICLLEALRQVPGVEVSVDLGHLVRVGIFPTQLDGGDGEALAQDFRPNLVNGVTGSGKHLILLYRLRLLNELFPGKEFLVLTHNRAPIHDLEARYFRLTGLEPGNVDWYTFNGWCRANRPDSEP